MGTIDTSGGREFWEAWVDSKTEPSEGATPNASGNANADANENANANAGENANGSANARNGSANRERRPRPERTPLDPGQLRLYLNLGRRDGLDETSLAALLTEKGVSPLRSELHSSHTYLIVTEGDEPVVIGALQGGKHGERPISCERARK
jgi:hypothetical protein